MTFTTENGWPSCGIEGCTQNEIPGMGVSIPLQTGVPNMVMKAFAADLNWYVEAYNGENDMGGWTATNSVSTSNHLGGTAMDYNWNDHPMGPQVPDPAAGWQGSDITNNQPEEPFVRELLSYYTADDGTQIIYWGNDWTTPHDSMHFQMGYGTFQNPAIQRWIDKHVDTNTGMSDFKAFKAGTPTTPPTTPVEVGFDRTKAIQALYDAVPVIDQDTATQLVDAVVAGLAQAQCNTTQRIAMYLAQCGHESDGFNTTTEYGDLSGAVYYPYIGRTWIQITWQSNYAAFGQWAASKGLVSDPNTFVNDPTSLSDLQWAGIGAAWYWTVQRPTINSLCDNGDVVGVTQLINGGQNGIDDRTERYNQAIALGDELLALVASATTTPPTGVDYMPTQDEWNDLVADVKEIRSQLNGDGLWPQTGNSADAIAALEKLYASGAPMSMLDMITWLKLHVSTHAAPTVPGNK